jgi:hypothetical protein
MVYVAGVYGAWFDCTDGLFTVRSCMHVGAEIPRSGVYAGTPTRIIRIDAHRSICGSTVMYAYWVCMFNIPAHVPGIACYKDMFNVMHVCSRYMLCYVRTLRCAIQEKRNCIVRNLMPGGE